MRITRPGRYCLGVIAVWVLLIALPGETRADSECPGTGSTGCWASACVFTPEEIFINGVATDGYRRAEYIIPDKGRIKYRTVRYFDDRCTQPDKTEVSEWLEDSKNFRKLESKTVDESLTVEHVAFGPFEYSNQGAVAVRGRFYVVEKNLLCTSSNLLYAEDGPALDMRPSANPDGSTMRRSCLHRLTGLLTPTSFKIVGTVVPPYPRGFESFEGVCIPDQKSAAAPCAYTIGTLQATRDDTRVGLYAGVRDGDEGNRARWRVTDYIDYPDVPAGHTFVQVGCQLNGAEDETVIAVLAPEKGRSMGPAGLGPTTWARKLNVTTGKFTEVKPSTVRCQHEALGEGYYDGPTDLADDAQAR